MNADVKPLPVDLSALRAERARLENEFRAAEARLEEAKAAHRLANARLGLLNDLIRTGELYVMGEVQAEVPF